MPPRPGENTLCTFFADVHYLISPPGHRPPHHRLEKSSYFYLYHGSSTSPRIEIANNPGTPYQDAFTGSLANASISHKPSQPNLVSFTVNRQAPQGYQDADGAWQLKAHDPTQRTEYMYQLHSVYVYFWTALDAESFVAKVTELGVGGLGQGGVPYQQSHQQYQSQQQQPQQQQQQVQRKSVSSGTGNSATMSPVVQKLEQAAITPTYSPSHQQNASTSTAGVSPIAQPTPVHSSAAPTQQQYQTQGHSSPPPPTASAGGTSNASAPPPLAYNPATPAAPEPIAHREKTPPPPDTGSTVAVQDVSSAQGYPYAQQGGFTLQQTYPPHQAHQQIPSYGSSPPPPPSGQPQPGSYTPGNNLASQQQGPYQGQAPQLHSSSPPPVSATGGLMTSSSPPPANGNNSLYSAPTPPHSAQNSMHAGAQQAGQQQQPQQQQQYQPQRQPSLPFQQYASSPPPPPQQQAPYNPQQQAYQTPLQSPSFTPQATTTTHPPTSPPPTQPSPYGQQQQQYNPQSQPQYQPQQQDQQQQQQQTHPTASQIHSQHYTPTTAETSATGGNPQTATNPGTPGRFEAKTEKLEKGVGRFLKKLDKKF